ncbi:MAG: hypothetical protein O2877_02035 [bacterium]|nr:hypothetical protein [bacterium]
MAFERLRGIFGSKPPDFSSSGDKPKPKKKKKIVFQAVPEDDHDGEPIVFDDVEEDDLGTRVIERPDNVNPDAAMDVSMIGSENAGDSGLDTQIQEARQESIVLGQEVASMKGELETVKKELEGMKEMRANPKKWAENIRLIEESGVSLDDQIAHSESTFFNHQVTIAEKELELAQARLALEKLSVKGKQSLPVSTTDKPTFVSVWDSLKKAMDNRLWRVSNYDEQRGVYGVTRGKGENMRSKDIPREDLEVLQTEKGRNAQVEVASRESSLNEVKGILTDFMEGKEKSKLVDARQSAHEIAEAIALEKKREELTVIKRINGGATEAPKRKKKRRWA